MFFSFSGWKIKKVSGRIVNYPNTDGADESNFQPSNEENLQPEVSISIHYSTCPHSDQGCPKVLQSLCIWVNKCVWPDWHIYLEGIVHCPCTLHTVTGEATFISVVNSTFRPSGNQSDDSCIVNNPSTFKLANKCNTIICQPMKVKFWTKSDCVC